MARILFLIYACINKVFVCLGSELLLINEIVFLGAHQLCEQTHAQQL